MTRNAVCLALPWMPMRQTVSASVFLVAGAVAAAAQTTPDLENGRYALAPTADGVVRLDTRTGSVSTCADKGSGWACHIIPDERAAFDAEIGRLQKDNDALKAELAKRGPADTAKSDEALPKQDLLKPKAADPQRKIEIPLPSDRDIDRMLSMVEHAWRRLVDAVGGLSRDSSGRI